MSFRFGRSRSVRRGSLGRRGIGCVLRRRRFGQVLRGVRHPIPQLAFPPDKRSPQCKSQSRIAAESDNLPTADYAIAATIAVQPASVAGVATAPFPACSGLMIPDTLLRE